MINWHSIIFVFPVLLSPTIQFKSRIELQKLGVKILKFTKDNVFKCLEFIVNTELMRTENQ